MENKTYNKKLILAVSESRGELVEKRLLGAITRASDLVGLRWGRGICIPNKFPLDADTAGP